MTTAGVAAGLIAGAAAFAAPAQADTTTTDDFLGALSSAGITNIDPGRPWSWGSRSARCWLTAARTPPTSPSTVADRLGRPLGPATMFTGIAVSFFCPRAVQDLADGQSPIPLPILNNLGF